MAISPNTNFITGQVLTADNANRWPRGIMGTAASTSNFVVGTTETVSLTASTFTAVANRYYKITYHEPAAQWPAGAGNYCMARIRLTNATGTALGYGQLQAAGATQGASVLTISVVTTFSAGSTVIVATAYTNTSTATFFRSPGLGAQITVEDIGPA